MAMVLGVVWRSRGWCRRQFCVMVVEDSLEKSMDEIDNLNYMRYRFIDFSALETFPSSRCLLNIIMHTNLRIDTGSKWLEHHAAPVRASSRYISTFISRNVKGHAHRHRQLPHSGARTSSMRPIRRPGPGPGPPPPPPPPPPPGPDEPEPPLNRGRDPDGFLGRWILNEEFWAAVYGSNCK